MANQQENETFRYTYSAKEQDEVKKIRAKYQPAEEDKMEQLRRLDRNVTQKGMMISLIVGILGSLVMGFGMCCAMLWTERWLVVGILVGSIGILLVAVAYPLYAWITKREREKIAPEILRLTDELMK